MCTFWRAGTFILFYKLPLLDTNFLINTVKSHIEMILLIVDAFSHFVQTIKLLKIWQKQHISFRLAQNGWLLSILVQMKSEMVLPILYTNLDRWQYLIAPMVPRLNF